MIGPHRHRNITQAGRLLRKDHHEHDQTEIRQEARRNERCAAERGKPNFSRQGHPAHPPGLAASPLKLTYTSV